MSWQLLIWNIFAWTFTGVMIYIMQSSMFWLLLPAAFTMTQSASDLVKAMQDEEEEQTFQYEVNEDSKKKVSALLEQVKRGKL